MSPSFCFSIFLAGPKIDPLSLTFSLLTQFPKGTPRFFCIFFPLRPCHSRTATLIHARWGPLLIVTTAISRDSAAFYASGWRSFQRWLQISSYFHPHFLLLFLVHTVFLGLVPKMWTTALPRFDVNFFFNLQVTWRLYNFLSSSEIESVSFV